MALLLIRQDAVRACCAHTAYLGLAAEVGCMRSCRNKLHAFIGESSHQLESGLYDYAAICNFAPCTFSFQMRPILVVRLWRDYCAKITKKLAFKRCL